MLVLYRLRGSAVIYSAVLHLVDAKITGALACAYEENVRNIGWALTRCWSENDRGPDHNGMQEY